MYATFETILSVLCIYFAIRLAINATLVSPRPLTVRRREKILFLLRRFLPRARMLDRSLSLGRRWHPTCIRWQSVQPMHREVLFHSRDRSGRHGSSRSAGLVFGHYLAHCNGLPEKRSERCVRDTKTEEFTFLRYTLQISFKIYRVRCIKY